LLIFNYFIFNILATKPKNKAMTNVYTLKDINNKGDGSFRGLVNDLVVHMSKSLKKNYIPLLNLKPKLMILVKSW